MPTASEFMFFVTKIASTIEKKETGKFTSKTNFTFLCVTLLYQYIICNSLVLTLSLRIFKGMFLPIFCIDINTHSDRQKYPVNAKCQNVPYLLLRLKPQLEKKYNFSWPLIKLSGKHHHPSHYPSPPLTNN